MKVKYVGQKTDGETAFSNKTNITWMPGDVHEVSAEHWELMKPYPGVFQLDTEAPPAGLENIVVPTPSGAFVEPAAIQLPDGSLLILNDMDKEALHKLAKDMSVAVHHSAGAPKVIDALQAAFPVKPPEA